jgi:hypothetical protein
MFHPSQHGSIKSKSVVTNLVTYRNDVLPSVCLHGQFVFILILARPSIKSLITLFCWTSSVILDYVHFVLSGSKATFHPDQWS